MSTYAELLEDLNEMIDTVIPEIVELDSDILTDEPISVADPTVYQLRVYLVGFDRRDANLTRLVYNVEIDLHHRLAVESDERAWTRESLDAILVTLTDPNTWRALPSVMEFFEEAEPLDEESTGSVTREGNVVTVSITAQVVLQP